MVSQSISFPLDDGFLRRECPNCEREFKWHSGPTDDRPADFVDPDVYSCPYCAETALPNAWLTKEQAEYARAMLAGPAMREIADELRRATRGGGGLLSFKIDYDEPEPPGALTERDDMQTVLPPCHPWEPIKVPRDWQGPLHCLVCGEAFALS